MKILIFGLPGSGKSTLAKRLSDEFNLTWINADQIREKYNDWDFSEEGRVRQAHRMLSYSKQDNIVIDFVCPYKEMRDHFNVDYKIWMNTIETGRFDDTNKIFQPPSPHETAIILTHWDQTDQLIDLIKP